jgi:cardiolipin synthase
MSEILASPLPWWGWMLIVIGGVAIVGVFGALFLPDWPQPELQAGFEASPGTEEFVNSAAGVLDLPVHRGGDARILQNGDAFYPAMLEAIRGARDTVNFQVYIFEPDEIGRQFMDVFKERARAGVEVRLLVDWFGSIKLKKRHQEELEQAGVRVQRFRPLNLRNLVRMYRRTHRRAIVVDGRIAFTGGAAVSAKWKGNVRDHHEWRDNMTRVTGQLVTGIQAAFATNWVYCTGEVLAGPRFYPVDGAGPGLCGISVASSPSDSMQPIRLLDWMTFINAHHKLWICNSYFIPDRQIRLAVSRRAEAGVDVRILVPGDQTDAVPVQLAGRSYYEELLKAGVRIFEFKLSMMHAKVVVADDNWTIVGSANLDERSLELNEENVLGIAGEAFAREVSEAIENDFAHSKEIKLEDWIRRPVWQRGLEKLALVLIEQY